MTAPHIGNTGVNGEDDESTRIWAAGYVVRDPALRASNWRASRELEDELADQGVVGVCEIDTRALTRHLRERGSMRVGLFSGAAASRPVEELLETVRTSPEMTGAALADEVTTSAAYAGPRRGRQRFTVVRVDLGIKAMTPQLMAERGIEVHVLPATATIDDVLAVGERGPTGCSSPTAPGDPATAEHEVALLREVLRRRIRSSASASATSCSGGPWASAPTS
jgi:carbamoyl-phosphate synthase small subunit